MGAINPADPSGWGINRSIGMLATLSGDLCLLLGLGLLLLPLLAVELSRPRDGIWGALVLLLGLVLVTSSERLRGAPMLAVLCSSLLIGRLGSEVGQARWRALDESKQQRLGSWEHWLSSLRQLSTVAVNLGEGLGSIAKQLKPSGRSGVATKKWVRPDNEESPDANTDTETETAVAAEASATTESTSSADPAQD